MWPSPHPVPLSRALAPPTPPPIPPRMHTHYTHSCARRAFKGSLALPPQPFSLKCNHPLCPCPLLCVNPVFCACVRALARQLEEEAVEAALRERSGLRARSRASQDASSGSVRRASVSMRRRASLAMRFIRTPSRRQVDETKVPVPVMDPMGGGLAGADDTHISGGEGGRRGGGEVGSTDPPGDAIAWMGPVLPDGGRESTSGNGVGEPEVEDHEGVGIEALLPRSSRVHAIGAARPSLGPGPTSSVIS